MLADIAIVVTLIVINGFFALSELAIVSARRLRLEPLAEAGNKGARRALDLAADPGVFLSTVQIGITLIGVVAGAYSGASFAMPLGDALTAGGLDEDFARPAAFAAVVMATTYVSLIIGELVPKRIALNNAEAIACAVSGPMRLLSVVAAPLVWFLSVSTTAVLAVLRVPAAQASSVSEEEVKAMINEGAESGVFEEAERDMLEGVFRLADRPVRAIMVPRTETVWLSTQDPLHQILEEIGGSGHTRFPVCRDTVDDVVGVLHVKDLMQLLRVDPNPDIMKAVQRPLYVSETMPVLKLLDQLRTCPVHMAIVLDEYGAFEGIVTPNDILVAIAGEFPEREGDEEPYAVRRDDGSWLIDASMPVDAVERTLGSIEMAAGADYATLAGFILQRLGHIPEAGETFETQGWRFEIVDLDGRRIDKVIATKLVAEEAVAADI